MKLRYMALAGVVIASQARAQEPVYEEGFLGSMGKLMSWIDSLDARLDRRMEREKIKQVARRMDRLARGLYRLCASKEDLALSLSSPLATDNEIRQDGEQIRRDLTELRVRFDELGETITRLGDTARVAGEAAIRNGLGGKAVLVDQLVYALRQPQFDRRRAMTQAKQAVNLCRQAQQAASLAAARMSAS